MQPIDHALADTLSPYLPPLPLSSPSQSLSQSHSPLLPFITLTYAQSLDSRIAAEPGVRTVISHAQTKSMTHFIRTRHDAILVGINTLLADNPSLNCRYTSDSNDSKIQPVIIDPHFKFGDLLKQRGNSDSYTHGIKILENSQNLSGLKPIFIVSENVSLDLDVPLLQDIIVLKLESDPSCHFKWFDVLKNLKSNFKINSVMIEGGANIINTLLNEINPLNQEYLVDSLIITVGPVFLGNKGVEVSPNRPLALKNVKWWTGIQDSVMCATMS